MSQLCDPTGFPLIPLPELAVAVQLLPLTKVQYECFLSQPGLPGDLHYEQLLELNPRVSCGAVTERNREGLFVTGILPAEAEQVAQWFGTAWRIPSKEEWQSIYGALAGNSHPFDSCDRQTLSRLAAKTIDALQARSCPSGLLERCLFRGGILEWVRFDGEWGGLGEPRPEFASYLIDPAHGDPIVPIRSDRRMKEFGARLIRAL